MLSGSDRLFTGESHMTHDQLASLPHSSCNSDEIRVQQVTGVKMFDKSSLCFLLVRAEWEIL